jgi:hypothetical protein
MVQSAKPNSSGPLTAFTVEFFGMPPEVTELPKIELRLAEGAGMIDLLRALRQAIPTFVGQVLKEDEEALTGHYAFNINGDFHFADSEVRLQEGDRIVLLLLATGG